MTAADAVVRAALPGGPNPSLGQRWRAAWQLGRSVRAAGTQRTRDRWLAAAVAGAGTLGIASVGIALMFTQSEVESVADPSVGTAVAEGIAVVPSWQLAPYLVEPGLRAGVMAAALLLAVPVVVLVLQLVRFGAAARERRLAALILSGATRADCRRIAVSEVLPAAMVGALVAGPAYAVLLVLLGVMPPPGWKLLPPARPALGAGWAAAALVMIVVVAASSARAGRAVDPSVVSPLGVVRRGPRPFRRRALLVPIGYLLAAVAGFMLARVDGLRDLATLTFPLGLAGAAITTGPAIMVLLGRRRLRSPDVAERIVGRRLVADPWTPGRVAGVLLACGVTLAVCLVGSASLVQDNLHGGEYDLGFYLGGFALAGAATVVVAVVAAASMTSGTVEQVLDSRRPTASLVALGASQHLVESLVARQLRAAAVPPCVAGAVLGWVATGLIFRLGVEPIGWPVWLTLPAAVIVAGGLAWLAATVVSRVLRGEVSAAASIENLRTP